MGSWRAIPFLLVVIVVVVPPARRSRLVAQARTTDSAPERGARSSDPADKTRRDFNNNCLAGGCHGGLRKRKWVHGPVALGACHLCHTPEGDPAEHKFSLSRDQKNLCSFCHAPSAAQEHVHAPFANAECGKCHDPHGGDERSFLIAKSISTSCVVCHEKHDPERPHAPASEGDCLVCHRAHQSRHEHLLTLPYRDLCIGCHREYEAVADGLPRPGLHVHGPIAGGCASCHRAHATPHRALLASEPRALCISCHQKVETETATARSAHGDALGDQSCTGCHAPHTSLFAHLLRETSQKLCFRCHDREIELASGRRLENVAHVVQTARFLHGPVRQGECTPCHRAHASDHRALLRGDYPESIYVDYTEVRYDLCFQCHDRRIISDERTTATDFRDGDRNLHHVHVNRSKGRACVICHEPHGSQHPRQMREGIAFGPGGWMLPIKFAKTERGGSCATGCHRELPYDNTTPPGASQGAIRAELQPERER